jgi:hypothetical protein
MLHAPTLKSVQEGYTILDYFTATAYPILENLTLSRVPSNKEVF